MELLLITSVGALLMLMVAWVGERIMIWFAGEPTEEVSARTQRLTELQSLHAYAVSVLGYEPTATEMWNIEKEME